MRTGRPRSVDPSGEEPVKIVARVSVAEGERLELRRIKSGQSKAEIVRRAVSEYLDRLDAEENEGLK